MKVVTGGVLVLALAFSGAARSAPPGEPITPMPATTGAGAPESAAAEPAPAAPAGEVARAQFTTAIRNREPVDEIHTLTGTAHRVYFFTELRGMTGGMVIHRWIHDGRVMASVPFQIHGPRWRVWSSKHLSPRWAGIWTVQVLNGAGKVLDRAQLRYTPAASPTPHRAPVR